MDGIINSVKNLFTTYGFKAAMIIVVTVAIVNLIKKPIMKKASRVAEQFGCDKSVVTKYVTYLPVGVAFMLSMFVELCLNGFNFIALDFGELFANAILYGALAIATYEAIKKQLEAYASKKNTVMLPPPEEDSKPEQLTEANTNEAQEANDGVTKEEDAPEQVAEPEQTEESKQEEKPDEEIL